MSWTLATVAVSSALCIRGIDPRAGLLSAAVDQVRHVPPDTDFAVLAGSYAGLAQAIANAELTYGSDADLLD